MKNTLIRVSALVFSAVLTNCTKKPDEPSVERPLHAGDEKIFQIAPGIPMKFRWCPPGNFVMGSPPTEPGREKGITFDQMVGRQSIEPERGSNEDQAQVTLTKGFWLAETEVTQDQWMGVMGNNPSKHKGSELPVDSVSWDDVQDFIIKVNIQIENPNGYKMTLPTEAQWEYACRSGSKGQYSGGTVDEVAWHIKNSNVQPNPVGRKNSNAWNLRDMHGNVMELCFDLYHEKLAHGTDPVGIPYGDSRTVRGGSWIDSALRCRAAARNGIKPDGRLHFVGFRPALAPSK
jgi:formylglycine-generating enzyme required for sulfatase activity